MPSLLSNHLLQRGIVERAMFRVISTERRLVVVSFLKQVSHCEVRTSVLSSSPLNVLYFQ